METQPVDPGRLPVAGALYGSAFGDALAGPTEFMSVDLITARYGPDGPADLPGDPAQVTDDTQMALAVGEALLAACADGPGGFTPELFEQELRKTFVDWLYSPDNNRAPGNTCMRACRGLAEGYPWHRATIIESKGCGANMRVAPIALVPGLDGVQRSGAAQLQAGLTHGHPTGLAAAELTALAVCFLAVGCEPGELVPQLREYGRSQRRVYHHAWLGELWRRAGAASPEDFIEAGWVECDQALARVEDALAHADRSQDPCLATGQGWIAEEALATGLYCFLLYPDDPVAALRRAAVTSGDSDSIACLTGAFAGARHGLAAWPADWARRIEYRDRIQRLADAWEGWL
ncbi:ADP-ribosylation/Crystallin J1 [Carbonactinospora thermoautotrophica]|uniref:ADP-ribosylation/Crystallin J1 n=1 Tax=Carbonactinospora thermoautotrophica TaxID=1469144 RepID=A0A132MWG6_9ACTN|nr:ADP-ribosylglycohydrolase family protein [Carbonactinospora thermoautotrophica]KWX02255.1 ADP-ribosylation/Crystallin J1 [Carbonactinospora thermoautotrophica]